MLNFSQNKVLYYIWIFNCVGLGTWRNEGRYTSVHLSDTNIKVGPTSKSTPHKYFECAPLHLWQMYQGRYIAGRWWSSWITQLLQMLSYSNCWKHPFNLLWASAPRAYSKTKICCSLLVPPLTSIEVIHSISSIRRFEKIVWRKWTNWPQSSKVA